MLRQAIRRASSVPPNALKPAYPNANAAAGKAFLESMNATKQHAEHTSKLWMKIWYVVGIPAIALAAINTYFVEMEHAEHRKHLAHVPDEEWPKQYEFMNMRLKPFFWGSGDRTLFWNPVVNRNVKN
ncbi:AaceriAFR196Cp [[Ashbya] aceris (nom. inval.)]|nr:AaceriAFR196Cp [[Ashbya] aceris (nom. inval.)]